MAKLTEAQLDSRLTSNLLYQRLNDSQKHFVKLYILNKGDFTDQPDFPAHKIYRYRRNPVVISLLRVFGFTSLKEASVHSKELLRLISERLRSSETSNDEFIRLATLAQDLQEKTKRKPRKPTVKSIDEAVLAAEKNI